MRPRRRVPRVRRVRLPSPSMAVALLALFVALGGVSYGVATGSIDSRELKNGTVRSVDLRNNDVRGADIRNGTVGTADLRDGTLLARDFAPGQLVPGEPGPQGPRGEQGPPGEDATKLFAYIRDSGSGSAATVDYGGGVTAVSDPAGDNTYTLTFARNLAGCVVHASQGIGVPSGMASTFGPASPHVNIVAGGERVEVAFYSNTAAIVDTAFMVAAFCL
jgi:hypothetical protein